MAFNQFFLTKSVNQTRGIFDKYIYQTTEDNVSVVTSQGYFALSRYLRDEPEEWIGGIIECLCADGYIIGLIQDDGTVMTIVSSQQPQTTAFGEMSVESLTPITQVTAQYGLLNGVLTVTDNAASGTTSIIDNKFTCDSGVAPDGLASITTLRQLAYRSGQGAMARFTCLYDAPQPNSIQAAGLITSENSFVFGYEGEGFGIIHSYGGEDELQELTLTAPATLAESPTVTIDGNGYIVNLTGGGSVELDAYEIATQLNGVVPNYQFTSNENQVVAQSVLPEPQGAFNYVGTNSTGAWVQITTGKESQRDFYPQAEWSENTKPDLDPSMGNVYQIQFQYLGFGDIRFFVEDSATGELQMVHIIPYANQNTVPSVTNPTFRIGWLAVNQGNTTSVRVQGSSASAFIEGNIVRDTSPRSEQHEQVSVGTSLTNILSIRNRISFGDKVNRAEIFPQLVTAASQTTKAAFFSVIANPIYANPITFEYVDKNSSIAEFSKDSIGVSGGQVIGSIVVTDTGSQIIRFNENENSPTAVQPATVLCIAAQMSSGSASDCQVSVTWQEDL